MGCVPALHRAAGISGAQQGTRLSTENRRTVQLSGGFLSVFQISLGVGTHGEAFAADGNGDAEGEVCSLLCGALWLVNIFLPKVEPLHSILMVVTLVFCVVLLISHCAIP